MPKELFGRIAEVSVTPVGSNVSYVVGGKDGLRITFDCKKSVSTDPNTATVSIFNLSETTRNNIEAVDGVLVLKAGYEDADGAEMVFVGNIKTARTIKTLPDIETKFEVSDGGVTLRDTKVALSYKSNTKLSQVVKDLIKAVGKPFRGDVNSLGITDKVFKTGLTYAGNARTILEQLGNENGFKFSIQDDESVIGVVDEVTSVGGAIVLSPDSGLVGSPEKIEDTTSKEVDGDGGNKGASGWNVTSKLFSKVVPSDYIEVQSDEIQNGTFFRVVEVNHSGDTHGDKWDTKLQLEQV